MYGIFAFDCLANTLFWIASVNYAYKLAHPTLIGTMAAMLNSIDWVIMKGIGSFVGGQLLELGMSITNLFINSAIFCAIWASTFYLIHILYGRELAMKLIKKNEVKRLELVKGQKSHFNILELTKHSEKEFIPDVNINTEHFSVTHF